LGKDIWPVGLCAIYPKWPLDLNFLPLGAIALTGVLFWVCRERWGRGFFFAWGLFLCALLPVLGLVNMSFLDQAYVADWWQQLALPAVTALGGAAFWLLITRDNRAARYLSLFGLGAGAVALALLTSQQVRAYHSMGNLCRRTLALNPGAWTAHNNLGNVLLSTGRNAEAAAQYETALALKPADPEAHSNLGVAYAKLGRPADAIAQYRAALAILPDDAKAWFNLGNLLRAQQDNAGALDALTHAVDANGRWLAARYELGTALLDQGRAREAGRQAETILHIDPMAISGHYLMARAAAAIGRFDVAADAASKALEIAREAGDAKRIQQMQEALDACKAGRVPAVPEL
jgi:tetratricopeptide (TPR) repeat protein